MAGAAGIVAFNPTLGTFGAFDIGNDLNLTGEKASYGCFSFWNDDLYYILPTISVLQGPKLYKLSSAWTVTVPTTPAWVNTLVPLPSPGPISIGTDNGTYSLVVNRLNEMWTFISGSSQSIALKFVFSSGALLAVNATAAVLPLDISTRPFLGFDAFIDDRRSVNEVLTLLIRDVTAAPLRVLLYAWNGSTALQLKKVITSVGLGIDLMLPSDERGDFRLWTDIRPATFITAITAPFAGRHTLAYTVRDSLSRPVNVVGEYALDKQTWMPMTHGTGDSGITSLATSLAGLPYTFNWDALQDLVGDYPYVSVRIIASIAGP
jgi:hypothetical protein